MKERAAFIEIVCKGYYHYIDRKEEYERTFYAVSMELHDGGISFKAGGHGYYFGRDDVVSIRPVSG